MDKSVTAAALREQMAAVLDEVEFTHESFSITRNGKEAGVLLPRAEVDAMRETIAILSDVDAVDGIAAGLADIAAGRVISEDQFLADWHARHH